MYSNIFQKVSCMDNQEQPEIIEESASRNEEMSDDPTVEELVASFPGFPEYIEKDHCCCKMTYYPEIKTYFWGEWEFQPCMPSFVIFLIVSSYICFLFVTIPKFGLELLAAIPILSFFGYLFLYSYIQIIKVGPGYFPFYWGARQYLKSKTADENNLINSQIDQEDEDSRGFLLGSNKNVCPKDGIMTSNTQYTWAHQLPRPERSVLARSARRIVLRPDHLCGWTTVWIGKRNHKLFILFNFYGLIYLSLFCVYMVRAIISLFSDLDKFVLIIIAAIYALFAISFAIMNASFVCSSIYELAHNITSWEDWSGKESQKYNRGSFMKNMEDVFGPYTSCCNWLKPTSPFTQYTNEELSNQYLLIRNQNQHQL